MCGGRARGGKTVTSHSTANTPSDVGDERSRRSRAEESRWGPLFLYDAVIVCRGRGVGVDGGESACALDELDELVVVTRDPLLPKRAG